MFKKPFALLMVASVLLCGCAHPIAPVDAFNALQDAGFKDIKIMGYVFLGCPQDKVYHTRFAATNLQGRKVKGTVCTGLTNSSIRFG